MATVHHAFNKFCHEKEIDDEMVNGLKIWAYIVTQTFPHNLEILPQYQTYWKYTALGCPGKTAQFSIN